MNTLENKTNNFAFKGIYGYMMLRFIGFCFIVFSQVAICVILNETALLLEGDISAFDTLNFDVIFFLVKLGNVGKPIIMCSLFALVFEKSKKIFHALTFYFVLALLFYLGEVFVFTYVLEPFVEQLLKTYNIDYSLVQELFPLFSTYAASYGNLNVFLDMFLCTLIYLFIFYTPKHIKGKWLYFYRFLVLLPLGYILTSTVFIILHNHGVIDINNIAISALLVKGSLPSFVVFISLVIFVKYRKNKYEKGNNVLSYDEYLKSSSYTFSYSLFLAAVLTIISIIEFALSFIPDIRSVELGSEYLLVFAIPFVLLFNISKPQKRIWPKIALPAFMTVHYCMFGISILVVITTILEVVSKFLGN